MPYAGRSTWVTIHTGIVHDTDRQMTRCEDTVANISGCKATEEQIHKLSQQLMQAQEDEPRVNSRELHDTVAQDLFVEPELMFEL